MSYTIWYWEYNIIYLTVDGTKEKRSGVITAANLIDAVDVLKDFYGEKNILNIKTLRTLTDEPVLEFDRPFDTEEQAHDFKIIKSDDF